MNRAMSRNGYSYVEGNPINYHDPSGKWIQVAIGLGIVAVVVATAIVAALAGVNHTTNPNIMEAGGKALEQGINNCKSWIDAAGTSLSQLSQIASHYVQQAISAAPSSSVASGTAGRIVVPGTGKAGLPDIEVPSTCIGEFKCQTFAKEFAEELARRSIQFTIWVDGGKRPALWEDNRDISFELRYPGIVTTLPGGGIAEPTKDGVGAYHVYVEHNGWVFDNFTVERGGPVQIGEYQNNMIAGGAYWRQHMNFSPANPFDYVKIFGMIEAAENIPRSMPVNELQDYAVSSGHGW